MMHGQSNRYRTVRMRAAAWATAIATVLIASPLRAQQSDATHPPTTVESLLADHFTTVAMALLSGNEELNDDRLTASRILLDTALELSPDDAELWRLRREHARSMADTEAE